MQRIEAVGGANAGPDPVLVAAGDLVDEVWVGHLRSGHTDKIQQPVGDRMPGGGDVGDACRMHHRNCKALLDPAGKIQERRRGRAHRRNYLRQALVVENCAFDDTQEINAFVHQRFDGTQPLLFIDAVNMIFVHGGAQADDKIGPDLVGITTPAVISLVGDR